MFPLSKKVFQITIFFKTDFKENEFQFFSKRNQHFFQNSSAKSLLVTDRHSTKYYLFVNISLLRLRAFTVEKIRALLFPVSSYPAPARMRWE